MKKRTIIIAGAVSILLTAALSNHKVINAAAEERGLKSQGHIILYEGESMAVYSEDMEYLQDEIDRLFDEIYQLYEE